MNKDKSLLNHFVWYFKQSIEVSKKTTSTYKKTMLVMFIVLFFVNWAMMQLIITKQDYLPQLITRSLIEAILYIGFCHFFIRSFLKLSFINRQLSIKLVSKLLLVMFIVAGLSFALSIGISKLDIFSKLDVTEIKFVSDDGSIDAVLSTKMFWLVGIIQQFVNFIIWSILYLAWQNHQSKKELQKQMQQAQIQQLTNQLSPHFLFNTFNSIRALIYEDQDKAADTVTQLAELFRTHLQAHLRAKSSLEEEWQVSQRYLTIEQTRLEERLNVSIDIDESLLQQQLPTLTLLTLVENAIKHGISPNSEVGYINIVAAKTSHSCWQLEIKNSVNGSSNAVSTKTGLVNIEKRLQLMFGEQAKFQYLMDEQMNGKNANYSEFTVRLELPYV